MTDIETKKTKLKLLLPNTPTANTQHLSDDELRIINYLAQDLSGEWYGYAHPPEWDEEKQWVPQLKAVNFPSGHMESRYVRFLASGDKPDTKPEVIKL